MPDNWRSEYAFPVIFCKEEYFTFSFGRISTLKGSPPRRRFFEYRACVVVKLCAYFNKSKSLCLYSPY